MKLYFLSASLFSLASAFSTLQSSPSRTAVGSNVVLSAGAKPMTPKEIMEQQRAKSGLPDPDEHPKLYSDELLDNMKEILLLLEKRVQGGQGSISPTEVESFVNVSNNILVEMKQKEYERLQDVTTTSPVPSPTPEPSASASASASASDVTAAPTITASANAATATDIAAELSTETEYSETEEGPAYSPAGGQGSLPKDTTNTYIIPGMDAMSPEEYRVALQKSISDRQAKRHASGLYGNRNTWDYLNNLSGDSGVLKKDELEN